MHAENPFSFRKKNNQRSMKAGHQNQKNVTIAPLMMDGVTIQIHNRITAMLILDYKTEEPAFRPALFLFLLSI